MVIIDLWVAHRWVTMGHGLHLRPWRCMSPGSSQSRRHLLPVLHWAFGHGLYGPIYGGVA